MKKHFLITLVCMNILAVISTQTPSIAIIGGGIGGTASAYFLNNLFGEKSALTLFEKDAVGGRLHLINVDGNYYESGGAVIHPRNKYMKDFIKILGLKRRKPVSNKFGIYDGDTFVFEESDWNIMTMAKFFWRYGFSSYQLFREVKNMLDDFDRIYALQEKGYAYSTVDKMLASMRSTFPNMTQGTLQSYLAGKIKSKLLLEELVQSVMMVNYGQTNNISAFAGFVSLAGADSNLWSINGGNKMVPTGLLKESKAIIVNGHVQEIRLEEGGSFTVTCTDLSNGTNFSKNFDIIILASPLIRDTTNIKFTNFKKDFGMYERSFHRTIATFVKGSLNPAIFNTKMVPDEILTFAPYLAFNSIGKVNPVKDNNKANEVYKVFSNHPLTTDTLSRLFHSVDVKKSKNWLAYPHYSPPERLPPFVLYPGLYYVNAVELSASAMEMSAISAKNAALLAYNFWNNLASNVDVQHSSTKDEL